MCVCACVFVRWETVSVPDTDTGPDPFLSASNLSVASINITCHAQAPGLVVPSDVHEVAPVRRQQGAAGGDVRGHLFVSVMYVCVYAS